MIHYVHHVPGRLRVKARSVKGDEGNAKQIKERLEALPGIIDVRANTTIGSITVHYDIDQQTHHALLDAFHHGGLPVSRDTQQHSAARPRGKHVVAKKVGDAIVSKVLETLLERTAMALVAALL